MAVPRQVHDTDRDNREKICFQMLLVKIIWVQPGHFFVLFVGLAFCSAKAYSILSMPMHQVHTLTCAHIVNYMYFDCFCCQIDKGHKKLLN